MVIPQISINGTSKNDLSNQYADAFIAIGAAIEDLSKCFPHGRDYQNVPPATYQLARSQHQDRIDKLFQIKNEIGEIIAGIQEQE